MAVRRLFNWNPYVVAIFVILTLNIQFFYLSKSVTPIGIKTDDLCFVASALFMIVVLFNFRKHLRCKMMFKYEMLFVIVMAVLSAMAGVKFYDQPFMMGFRAQRVWMMMNLMYFPLLVLLRTGVVTQKEFINTLYVFIIVYLGVAIAQYVVGDKHTFTYVMQNMRYGTKRYYFEYSYVFLITPILLFNILRERGKTRWKNIIILAACVFFIVGVIKGRMATVSYMVACLVGILISKGSSAKRLFQIFLVVGLSMAVFQMDIVQDFIDAVLNTEASGNTAIREVGRDFYIEVVKAHPLSGYGLVNIDWNKAVIVSRVSRNIYSVDNGIFGAAFYYGITGVIWWIILTVKSMIIGFRVNKANGNFTYICYLLMNCIGIVSLQPGCFESLLTFPMFLALLESEYKSEISIGRIIIQNT